MKKISIWIPFFFMAIAAQPEASTGNLRGSCWQVANEHFPDADLVGMTGGTMSGFDVSGFLIDKKNIPHKFRCYFSYSHGKPTRFVSDVFASEEDDPVVFTRKTFERQQTSFKKNLEWKKKRDALRRKEFEEFMQQ